MAIQQAKENIEQSKSILESQRQQVEQFRPEINLTKEQLLRQTPQSRVQIQALESQRQALKQKALQELNQREQQLSSQAQSFEEYLQTPSGIKEYAREFNIKPREEYVNVVVEGHDQLVPVYTYRTPYGTYVDDTEVRKAELLNRFYVDVKYGQNDSLAVARLQAKYGITQVQAGKALEYAQSSREFQKQIENLEAQGLKPIIETSGGVTTIKGFEDTKIGMSYRIEDLPSIVQEYRPEDIPQLERAGIIKTTTIPTTTTPTQEFYDKINQPQSMNILTSKPIGEPTIMTAYPSGVMGVVEKAKTLGKSYYRTLFEPEIDYSPITPRKVLADVSFGGVRAIGYAGQTLGYGVEKGTEKLGWSGIETTQLKQEVPMTLTTGGEIFFPEMRTKELSPKQLGSLTGFGAEVVAYSSVPSPVLLVGGTSILTSPKSTYIGTGERVTGGILAAYGAYGSYKWFTEPRVIPDKIRVPEPTYEINAIPVTKGGKQSLWGTIKVKQEIPAVTGKITNRWRQFVTEYAPEGSIFTKYKQPLQEGVLTNPRTITTSTFGTANLEKPFFVIEKSVGKYSRQAGKIKLVSGESIPTTIDDFFKLSKTEQKLWKGVAERTTGTPVPDEFVPSILKNYQKSLSDVKVTDIGKINPKKSELDLFFGGEKVSKTASVTKEISTKNPFYKLFSAETSSVNADVLFPRKVRGASGTIKLYEPITITDDILRITTTEPPKFPAKLTKEQADDILKTLISLDKGTKFKPPINTARPFSLTQEQALSLKSIYTDVNFKPPKRNVKTIKFTREQASDIMKTLESIYIPIETPKINYPKQIKTTKTILDIPIAPPVSMIEPSKVEVIPVPKVETKTIEREFIDIQPEKVRVTFEGQFKNMGAFDVSPRVKDLIVSKAKDKTKQKSKSILDMKQKDEQIGILSDLSDLSSGERTGQRERQETRTLQGTKQIQEQVQTLKQLTPLTTTTTTIPTTTTFKIPIKPPKLTSSSLKSAAKKLVKRQNGFDIFIRRYGKDIKKKTTRTLKEAERYLGKGLKGSLAASGFIVEKGTKRKIPFSELNLGMEFRPSKVDMSRVVQKRKFRLGTFPEISEIQSSKKKKKSKDNFFDFIGGRKSKKKLKRLGWFK